MGVGAVLRRLVRRVRGWRTLFFSLVVAGLGVVEATDWAELVPDGPDKGWWLFWIGIATAWLRVITTGPVGGTEVADDDR